MNQSSTKKALVVEDNPDMLEVLSCQLQMLGFSVITANNGREGVKKAIKEKPQLILMDILASTALFLSSDLSSCIKAGCSSYISKPFTSQELREKIQHIFPIA